MLDMAIANMCCEDVVCYFLTFQMLPQCFALAQFCLHGHICFSSQPFCNSAGGKGGERNDTLLVIRTKHQLV